MARFDMTSELRAYVASADEVRKLLAGSPAALVRPASAISNWSAAHHAAHLTLANELILRNLRSLSKGEGLLVVYTGEQNPRALERLERGDLLRGQAQSPRMVIPPADVDVPTVSSWAEAFARDLADFARTFDAKAERRTAFVPHQLLGPLDLCEWARFGVVHTRHHLAIAREVLAAHG